MTAADETNDEKLVGIVGDAVFGAVAYPCAAFDMPHDIIDGSAALKNCFDRRFYDFHFSDYFI